jgi:hypothetical protein
MPELIRLFLDAEATSIDGTPMTRTQDGKEVPATWGWLAHRAVATRFKGEEDMSWDKCLERGKLAKRLARGGEIRVTSGQLEEIKRLFAKAWQPDLVAGFAELVEQEEGSDHNGVAHEMATNRVSQLGS